MNDVVTVVPLRHREPWTAAEVYHLGRLHEAKRSAVSIAAVLQRSEHAVRMKAAELAMWFPRECKDYRGAYRAYEQGMSWPLILATFGLSKGDVHWWVKRFGGGLPWPPVSELEAK